jgi:hypothetical protein
VLSASEENEKSKNLDSLNQEVKVGEKFQKFKAETSNHISDISFATIAQLKNDFQESMKNHCEFEGTMLLDLDSIFESTMLLDLDSISLHMCSLLHHGNNTVLAVVKTVFDPGGIVKPLSVTITLISTSLSTFRLIIMFTIEISVEFVVTVFDPGGVTELISVARISGTITLTSAMPLMFRLFIVFAIEFFGEFAVTVFDPGGNRPMSLMRVISLLLLQEMEAFDSFFVWALDRCCQGDCGSEECVAVLIPVEIAAARRRCEQKIDVESNFRRETREYLTVYASFLVLVVGDDGGSSDCCFISFRSRWFN